MQVAKAGQSRGRRPCWPSRGLRQVQQLLHEAQILVARVLRRRLGRLLLLLLLPLLLPGAREAMAS
jgi:hypothetical protein